MEIPEPEEIPVFDEATERLLHAARVATAAGDARRGYREAVEGLVSAAMGLPGCRFVPTGEELIKKFLQKKVSKEPMTPVPGMRETNVSLYNPMTLAETLPEVGEREWYFFTPRDRKYKHGVRPNRKTDGGFWKATGADKAVRSSEGETIGFKKTLVFNLGEHDRGRHVKTDWIMYEYRLNQPPRIQEHEDDMRLDDWVLCSIHDQPHAWRVAAKRKFDHHMDGDVNPYYEEPLQQYAQQPSSSVEAEEYGYLEQQQQLHVVEQEQLQTTFDVPLIPSSSSSFEEEQYRRYQYSVQQPMPLINNVATSASAEQYCRSYQQDELEQLPSLSVVDNRVVEQEYYENLELQNTRVEGEQYRYEHDHNRVVEQEYYANLELQQNTRVEGEQYRYEHDHNRVVEQEYYANLELQQNTRVVAEQYRYQHGQYQYQYMEQQPPLPSLDVVEQEQYAYHLPTTLNALVIDVQEQYARVEAREQYRYLEQQPMAPLINKEQLITPDNNIPMPLINKEQLITPDNSIPQPGVGFEFDWINDFFDLSELIDDNYMSSNQSQGTKGETAASIHSHSQHQQQQHQHQGY